MEAAADAAFLIADDDNLFVAQEEDSEACFGY